MGSLNNGVTGGTTFDGLLEWIRTISNVFLVVLLLSVTLLLGATIAMRFFLGQPIAWSNAVSRYIYIYIVLIGSAISYMLDGHAIIESFYNVLPKGFKPLCDLAHYLIVMSLCVLLIFKGIKYTMQMWGVHSPVLPWFPMGIVYFSIPLSFLIIFLFLLRKTTGLGGKYRRKEKSQSFLYTSKG